MIEIHFFAPWIRAFKHKDQRTLHLLCLRPTVQMDVGKEQVLTFMGDAVRHANVSNVTTGPGGMDHLHHRFLSPNSLQHRIGANPLGQFFDACNSFVASLHHNVRRTKFVSGPLTKRVATQCDVSFRAQLLGQESLMSVIKTIDW